MAFDLNQLLDALGQAAIDKAQKGDDVKAYNVGATSVTLNSAVDGANAIANLLRASASAGGGAGGGGVIGGVVRAPRSIAVRLPRRRGR